MGLGHALRHVGIERVAKIETAQHGVIGGQGKLPFVGKLDRHRFRLCLDHLRVSRLGNVADGILVTPEHCVAIMDPDRLLVIEPEPVELVVWIDPVGIETQAFAALLERDLAVLANVENRIFTAGEANLAHIHPRFEDLTAPVG